MVRTRRVYSGSTLLRVLYPVALCMLFVAINVSLSTPPGTNSPEVIYGLFNSYDTTNNGWITLIFMGSLVLTTSMGVCCYKKRYYKAITVYITANNVALLIVYAYFHFRNVVKACSIPLSSPTAAFLVIQFGVLGMICVHWKCHQQLHQFYLIMLASLTALFLLSNLPDWSVWLATTAISIWDIIAVLTPCGPLKMLVETANRRGDEKFPAILYSTTSYVDTPETTRSDSTQLTEFPLSSTSVSQYGSLLTSPVITRQRRKYSKLILTCHVSQARFEK